MFTCSVTKYLGRNLRRQNLLAVSGKLLVETMPERFLLKIRIHAQDGRWQN